MSASLPERTNTLAGDADQVRPQPEFSPEGPGQKPPMPLVRRLARPLLASMFVSGGLDSLRNPGPKVPVADDVAPAIAAKLHYLPEDTETLVKINGAVQVGAGMLLALGRFPRLSATLLAASLIPTTAAAHRFWEVEDEATRRQQRIHFFKNAGLLGGLILAAVDTEGRPGLAWRARHVTHHVAEGGRRARRTARLEAKIAAKEARLAAHSARAKLPG
jgi:putative oxidoreductase